MNKCVTQLAGGFLLKILRYFEVMLNIFEFSHMKEMVESWLVYGNKSSCQVNQEIMKASKNN